MPNKFNKQEPTDPSKDFAALVAGIQQVHSQSAAVVNRVVNTSLTLRNWMIGAYIDAYELRGEDRAAYGEQLLQKLAERLKNLGVPRSHDRELRRYRSFYLVYPQIRETLPPEMKSRLTLAIPNRETASPELENAPNAATTDNAPPYTAASIPANELLSSLSFSHFDLLLALDDPLKRAFYEIESIRGSWSVRALKRQITSLYFERSGLSLDKEKLSAMANELAETTEPSLSIRDPYIFEFLGLKPHETMAESDLENGLLKNLQEFLLELGHGFCLEAQQKSILIGNTRGFVDLVFYHRVLKCHILVELKADEFRHEHIGQLNTYVAWYQKNMMQDGDNPPIGLLLCTGKDHALVEYALSSMSDRLFVSKYQLQLPSTETLQQFIDTKRREVTGEL